jgi:hypothetical protein
MSSIIAVLACISIWRASTQYRIGCFQKQLAPMDAMSKNLKKIEFQDKPKPVSNAFLSPADKI